MLWGFSPATDLLGHMIAINPESVKPGQTLNILLAGAADPRHILKTVAKYYTHDVQVTINFYVAEVLVDFIARELLLLTLALEPEQQVPLSRKTHLWMEIFGNALVRPSTVEYIYEKSVQLVHMVTDEDFQKLRLPCVDLSDLKYKEKDSLEMAFKYWTGNSFNVSQIWDARLRKKLGVRYDSKNGVFEWDYFMKMVDKHEPLLVNSNEYNQWRKNGVAFVWLETEYCMSNPTFAMGVHSGGDTLNEFGYFGDMEIGPYYTFATDCEDEGMLKKSHHNYMKRGTDIFQRNLSRCLHEVEHQCSYVKETEDRNLGQVVLQINELDVNPKPRLDADVPKTKENYSAIPINHKIHFLNTKSVENLPNKSKFQQHFDAVFVASNLEKILMKNDRHKKFFGMMKSGAVILWETRKTRFDISKEGLKKFEENVKMMMEENGCKPVGNQNFDKDFIVAFSMDRKSREPIDLVQREIKTEDVVVDVHIQSTTTTATTEQCG